MLDSLPLNAKLRRILQEAGPAYEVGGNTPFLLNQPGVVWMIVSGTVEIFTVRLEEGQPAGPRYHFFTANEGDLLFGMDLDRIGQNLGFLAVGVVGTRICQIPFPFLQGLAHTPEFGAELSNLIDNWINGLSFGVTKSIYPKPRVDSLILPGTTFDLEAGQKARSKKGIVWVQFVHGNSLFIGMEEVSFQSEQALFPLSQETWIESISSSQFVSVDTPVAVERGVCWDGLEALYEVLFKCEFFNTTLASVDEYNRLQKKGRARSACTR